MPKKAPEAPEGYDAWLATLEGVADEGMTAFSKAWNESQESYRKHLARTAADRTRHYQGPRGEGEGQVRAFTVIDVRATERGMASGAVRPPATGAGRPDILAKIKSGEAAARRDSADATRVSNRSPGCPKKTPT